MNPVRRERLGAGIISCVSGMQTACQAILEEAMEKGIVYDIHGEQMATPPGAIKDLWRVRTECVDGYARTFDEMRRTVDEIGTIIAKEEQERTRSEDYHG